MFQIHRAAILLCCTLAACSPESESSPGNTAGVAIQTAAQESTQPEITPEKISRDVVGHAVQILDDGDGGSPSTWTFEASEFRQVEILERQVSPTTATITVFMTTRDNPESGEDTHIVTGKLRLAYQHRGTQWVLTGIENLTFRGIAGIST